jgi:hypothetical protein
MSEPQEVIAKAIFGLRPYGGRSSWQWDDNLAGDKEAALKAAERVFEALKSSHDPAVSGRERAAFVAGYMIAVQMYAPDNTASWYKGCAEWALGEAAKRYGEM